MNSNLKILDILIETLGPQTIIDICSKRLSPIPTSLPERVLTTEVAPDPLEKYGLAPCGMPSGLHAPTLPGMTPVCCERAILGSPLIHSAPVLQDPPPLPQEEIKTPEKVSLPVEAPPAPKKIIVKVKKNKPTPDPVAKDLTPQLETAKPSPLPVSIPAPAPSPAPVPTTESKKTTVKKQSNEPRCEGRVYGEKVEMEGTKAPTGGPLHAYKIAQCDRHGKARVAIDEDGSQEKLEANQEPTEGQGVAHLCVICMKRWEARKEHPENWHGLFDIDTWPDTSHFVGGAWYRGKMAKVTSSA